MKQNLQLLKRKLPDFSFGVIENVEGGFLVETNENAPNSKILFYESKTKSWKPFLPEKPEPLQGAGTAGGKLFVSYSKDVTSRVYVYDLKGKLENEVQLPGLGTVGGFGGEKEDAFVFYTYTSFNYPPTIFQI